MEDMENAVWQRVFSGQGSPLPRALGQLVRECADLAARYGQLMEGTSGKRRELLRRLREGEQANLHCLLGILNLARTPMTPPTPLPKKREPMIRALEGCWHRTRLAMVEYAARSAEPEFGPVFRSLSDREAEHCVLLAQLLGSLQ